MCTHSNSTIYCVSLHLHSPDSASYLPHSLPCGGSPGSCAAGELSLFPVASDSIPDSFYCSPKNQLKHPESSPIGHEQNALFHDCLYKKRFVKNDASRILKCNCWDTSWKAYERAYNSLYLITS